MFKVVTILGIVTAIVATVGVGPAADGASYDSISIRGQLGFDDPADITQVFIQFVEPSVAQLVADGLSVSPSAQRSHSRAIRAQHETVKAALGSKLVEVRSHLVVAANGIRAMVRAGDIEAIANTPGVKTVSGVTRHTVDLTTSVPAIGAATVAGAGFTGSGVTVAVIDTGIDYTHASFGGPGTSAAYTTNHGEVIEPGSFPTPKVVDGYDLAGTNYDAADPSRDTPIPDPDPLDGAGHGTHVAATIAGVDAPGPLVAGVAADASLMALKVFGDGGGSTDLVSDAIERALDPNGDGSIADRVDVINMSLGSEFGHPNDPSAIAARNAVANGVVVVASAGNSGPIPYITGAPAVGDDVISVAASVDSGEGPADAMTAFTSRGPGAGNTFKPDISAPGLGISAAAVGTGNGAVSFNGTSMAAPHVAGAAAQLLERYPGLEPGAVKALLMNSARPAQGPGKIPLTSQGTGIVQIDRAALDVGGYAFPAGISFGRLNPSKSATHVRTIAINRLPGSPNATYDVEVVPNQTLSGVSWTLASPTVTTLGGSAEIELSLRLDPTAMDPDDAPYSQSEADGWVRFTNQADSDDTMVVGILAVVDPAAGLTATAGTGSVSLRNTGPAPGFAEGFTRAVTGGGTSGALDALGYRTANGQIEFALALDTPWAHPSALVVYLFIDTDRNGSDDYLIVAMDSGYLSGTKASGTWVTAIENQTTSATVLGYPVQADLNDRVAVLTVDRSGVGGFLGPGDDDFTIDLYVTGPGGLFGFIPNIDVNLDDEITSPDGVLSAELAVGSAKAYDFTESGDLLWLMAGNNPARQVATMAVTGVSHSTTTTTTTTFPPDQPPTPKEFVDVPATHVFHDDIIWLADAGVTRGCNPPTNDRFCPDDPVSRGQMAAFLNRSLLSAPTSQDFFTDVANSVFESDINRLAASGVTKGCNPPTNDLFCPERNLTRAEMATFLVRGFGLGVGSGSDLFADDNGNIHETAIDILGTVGVTRGCNPPVNDRFCPDRLITRGEMAAFLARADNTGASG